ncbi:MAG: glycosyltransferase family 2 protein [Dehalococcoidales bacterium]|nr:glycosyltransferase family 2 protein [Dehalococcoidales bacterium]
MSTLLSVIICTYNRAALLAKCLDSLIEQKLDSYSFEVVVVDNNSSDNTGELITRYKTMLPNIRYVFEGNQGLSYARNRGCAEAVAKYLVYLDDDAIAPPHYLMSVTRIIEDHSPDIMGGPVYPYYTSKKPRWFKDEYEIREYETQSGFSRTCSISGGNYIIKKRILESLGLFDVNLGMRGNSIGIGEERKVLETYRATTPEDAQKVYYALECYVKHHVPAYKMKISYIMKRCYASGRSSQKISAVYAVKSDSAGETKVLLFFINLCGKGISRIFTHLKRHGLRGVDYIQVSRKCFVYLGTITGMLDNTMRRKR